MAVRTRNQMIAFRVTPAEAKKIREKVRQSGLSQQGVPAPGFTETADSCDPRTQAHPGGVAPWGRNLNQLTILAHRSYPDGIPERTDGSAGQNL